MPKYTFCSGRLQINSDKIAEPMRQFTDSATPIDQLDPLVASAFASPIEFPPIADAVVANDAIAIAVGENVPDGIEIAVAIANHLLELGHDKSNITIVASNKPPASESSDEIVVRGWPIELHDPADSQKMAYLCLDSEGRPYHINRCLFDADVVIPVGNSDGQQRLDPISPALCDVETQKLLSKLPPKDLAAAHRAIGHNLGIFWQVQVVSAPQQTVHAIMAGQNEPLIDKAIEVGRQAWAITTDAIAAMTIATLEAQECQTWKNVRSAILLADQLTAGDGPILICCNISRKPPGWWSVGEQGEDAQDEALTDIFRQRHIYLASRLGQESTEQIGFGHVEDSAQMQRLVDSFPSVVLLREAHKVRYTKASTPAH